MRITPGRKQQQRAVNCSPATWRQVQRLARDQSRSAAELVGDALDDLVARGNPHPISATEHEATVSPLVDSCGIDDSFNDALRIVEHWLSELVDGVRTETERKAVARRLKAALNRLEARLLAVNNHAPRGARARR